MTDDPRHHDPRYPIGPFAPVLPAPPEVRRAAVADVAALPERIRAAVAGLTEAQIDTPYRDGGWTVRQVVHHVADSHMQAFIRLKLALTEDKPTIKPYDEKAWAELADARLPIELSLSLLDGLHRRWAAIYESLSPAEWARPFVHPELEGVQTLDRQVQTYGWHSRHHVGHITELRRRSQW
jgi:hypothetical protein